MTTYCHNARVLSSGKPKKPVDNEKPDLHSEDRGIVL